MPDITDQILNRLPYRYADEFLSDPRELWVYESDEEEERDRISARFINKEIELLDRPHWDTDQLDECILEIKQSLLDWVSAGLIAKWLSRYRLWQKKFSSWKNFCMEGLGRDPWKIKKLIEDAEIMVELAKEGFSVLPSNKSQVERLDQCAKKLGCLISEAWETVISRLPEKLITADSIAEVLGFPAMNVNKRMSRDLADHLDDEADERGLTLEEMLAEDYGFKKEGDNSEDEEISEPDPEAIERWEADLKELVAEHDRELWLLCSITKLANFIPRRKSQFFWLHEYRQSQHE